MVRPAVDAASVRKKVTSFADLSENELELLAQRAVPKRVAAGETLFNEGDPCSRFYVIAEGRVRIFKIRERFSGAARLAPLLCFLRKSQAAAPGRTTTPREDASILRRGEAMARSKGERKYGKKAASEVRTEMRHYKQGKHGKRVKSLKQAIAIGLSKARKEGAKVPRKRAA